MCTYDPFHNKSIMHIYFECLELMWVVCVFNDGINGCFTLYKIQEIVKKNTEISEVSIFLIFMNIITAL